MVSPAEICLFSWSWALLGGSRLPAGQTPSGRVTSPGWDLPPLSQSLDLRGQKLSLLLVRTENNICLGGDLQEYGELTLT